MKKLGELDSYAKVEAFIKEHELSFLYVSRPDCSVCHAILPKLQTLLEHFPQMELGQVNALEVAEISGHLSIFTAPTLLLFVEGKEYLREDRFVRFADLEEKLKRIYELYTSD
ncbi:thioredoxin family protein [Paenibacillus motobuensis]|uniref:thioredoxin family protein n=1 Tax=Paenibacillus TaxID=44249 RepID=UPI002042081B|nr:MULTISPECIES: thioredoxin family protein [Paenibacillus]MCM3040028.1 thioredoxin family protein [Paenibacillus lutimineralis]MCM3647132.1 thioredoxin family protein [Paenibacillus motobuensis]